jgi:hypothetical protein
MYGFAIFMLILNLVAMAVFYGLLSSRYSSKKILSDLRSEVDKLVADLGREADRDVALLESRIKSLRGLIDDADRRILLADREESRRQQASTALGGAREPSPPSAPSRAIPAQNDRSGDTESASQKPRATGDAVTVYSRPTIRRSEIQIEPAVPARERVLELAMKGISPEMIAHTLSLPLGEVQLILDMNDSSM